MIDYVIVIGWGKFKMPGRLFKAYLKDLWWELVGLSNLEYCNELFLLKSLSPLF